MIDVVIPVYRGAQQTRRCIESVLAHAQQQSFETVVVDDASPDAAIAVYVDELAKSARITLLRNDANVGFARSVNRAMALHAERDVVLLNSDTEVANDWLDRLHRIAHGDERVGTVTPFSNNATICSYPFHGWSGGMPGALGLAALDRLFATTNAGRSEDLATAVGFCMYIRRDCLGDIGLFDAERFGRGYGEENDFCMRAAKAGWRHVIAADVFVFHEGAVSFSDQRRALTEAATQTMLDVHPDYLHKVREFILRDPLFALRAAVDDARLAHGETEARHVLVERTAEREALYARLRDADLLATQRGAEIEALRNGLERAESLAREGERALAERAAELARVSAGLAHAEKLAFERADQLERIHGFWAWKYIAYLMRAKS